MYAGRLGPYSTVQLLGRGAFGEVLLAEDVERPGHLVALKVGSGNSDVDDAASDKAADVVRKEGELLRRLKHPNIVGCEDIGWDSERRLVWLALELLDGGSIRNLIDSRLSLGSPFQAHFVRRVLCEIGSALCYIHSEGVLHRDVKPANILLTLSAPPMLKLADFGISKLLEGTGLAHTIVGTQYYFSPELAAGQPYGPASDAWALGVCLFELATLKRPFLGSSMFELAACIRDEPHPQLPAETAPDVAQAISGLLEKDPAKRLQLQDDALDLMGAASSPGSKEPMPPPPPPVPPLEEDQSVSTQQGLVVEELTTEPLLASVPAQPHAPAVAFESQAKEKRASKEPRRANWWFSWWPITFSKAPSVEADTSETRVTAITPESPHPPLDPEAAHRRAFEPLTAEDVEIWDLQDLPGQASSTYAS
eukprot:TRINITY_DN50082_c0_g1_i1.p1 TRINITY_DN50082_c0_g1~~TRINITY_DN50082_c0_g1_i1.p1  ORF type:complete len:423 (-),score=86.63 TRINITY_DN50082_c0_g1_i1:89-1357(-)